MCDAVLSPRILISGADGKMSNYVRAVRAAGGTPVSGYCPPPDLSCAGLLLCGGGDLDPVLYGQPDQGSQPPDPARDQAELELFRAFYQAGRPILGVCRGMQIINVAWGAPCFRTWGTSGVPPIPTPPGGPGPPGPRPAGQPAPHPLRPPLLRQQLSPPGGGLPRPRAGPYPPGSGRRSRGHEHPSLPILGVQFHPGG